MTARKWARMVLSLIALLAILYPCIELADCWDDFSQTGQDTELMILAMLLMFGCLHVFTVATAQFLVALRSTFSPVLSTRIARVANPDAASKTGDLFPCLIDLEVPLRI